ncbi:MAG: DNA circularization N-terminal domain-containing protein [Evtepia sp.]
MWPHNPRTYRITYQRQVAVQKVPFGRYALQNLGLTRRVMEGEGEFFGPEAYDEFRKLASVFYQEGPGMLIHPVWQSANVYFVGLALAQEPKQDYVRYTFTFWEDENRYRQKLVPVGQKKTPGAVSKPAAPSSAGNGGAAAGAEYHYRDPGRDALGDRPEPGG